jgi:hypothetical protein
MVKNPLRGFYYLISITPKMDPTKDDPRVVSLDIQDSFKYLKNRRISISGILLMMPCIIP